VIKDGKKGKLLHIERKKVEAERIDEENLKLLNKITRVKSTLPKSKLDEEYKKSQRYKNNINKQAVRKIDFT
jgi:hypothetical protein